MQQEEAGVQYDDECEAVVARAGVSSVATLPPEVKDVDSEIAEEEDDREVILVQKFELIPGIELNYVPTGSGCEKAKI